MTRRLLLPILYAAIIAQSLYALNPPPGSRAVGMLATPYLLSASGVESPSFSPAASNLNPAAAASATLPNVGLRYLGLADAARGYVGTGIEAGMQLPGAYGVYSASALFLTSGSPAALGTLGALNLSIAKALYPKLLVGAGLGLVAGRGDRFDWGLGLDLGFISLPGRLGPLNDFRWGAAIDDIGKPFTPSSAYSSVPSPFTPTIGAGFTLYKSQSLTASLSGSLSFPSFQDLRVGVGGSLAFGESVRLNLAGSLDLRELAAGSPPFPLAASVGFTITPGGHRAVVSHLRPAFSVEPVAPSLYAFAAGLSATVGRRDTQPPRITVEAPKISYISPNGDGVQDTLRVPFSISDRGPVASYELTIRDSTGQPVDVIKSPSVAITATGAAGLLDRLFYRNAGVSVPPALVWNGTNENGRTVPDGTYTYTIAATDESGNRARSAPSTVVVDTKQPQIDLTQPQGAPPIFSPNGDGYKDTLSIVQSGSRESLWVGRFLDAAGKVVRTVEWKDSSPRSFVWDGRGNGGKVLPDGVYSYEIGTTDRAGNSASASIPTIIIDTTRPAIRLDVTGDAISPGTTSPKQRLEYLFEVPDRASVSSWKLVISDSRGTEVRSVAGGAAMPAGFTFNGSDQQGNPLPDGVYDAELSVVFRNGSHSFARAAAITIDRVAPSASVNADYHVFSPVGAGAHSAMTFSIQATTETLWTGSIANGGGEVVRSYRWHGRPPAKLTWNGRGAGGRIEPDGVYQFSIASTDEAGNFAQSNVASFVLDTQHKQLFLSTDVSAFSPNGARPLIRIIPDVRSPKGFESYRIQIESRSGRVVGSFSGTGVPTGPFAWNGLESGDRPVPAGEYRATMSASYATGATVTAETPLFAVITELPTLELSANYHIFSPNGDGHRDTVTFTQSATGGSSWTGRIVAQDGKTLLEKQWEGSLPAAFTWNGRDSLGNLAGNGSYSYILSARDAAGNVARALVGGIVLDNSPTQVYVDTTSRGFSPNGDGIKDTIEITTLEKPAAGIASWKLSIAGSTTVKDWSGSDGAPPASLVWNGTTDSGAVAPDGSYRVELQVHYVKGDRDQAQSEPFLLVAKAPEVRATLSPLPFTPPAASGAGSLHIHLAVKALDPIASWKLQIYTPPIEEPFFAFSGQGNPPDLLAWDGRSAEGRTVVPNSVYSYHLTLTDSLGNRALLTGNIPIGPAPQAPSKQKPR